MAKFFPNLDYGFKSLFHEGNAEERIKILKKH